MARVFLTDFGLARHAATGSRYTRTGEALGTPAYMSPEQARGEVQALTPATDAWSLGCVLYELASGRRPFLGDSPGAVIGAVLATRPPRLRGVGPGVAMVVAACLHKDARARYPAAGPLRADCETVLAGQRPRGRAARGRTPLLAGAVVATLALGGWLLTRPDRSVDRASPGRSAAEATAERAWERRRDDPAGAANLLREALRAEPTRDDWRVQLGLLCWAGGDLAEADRAFADVPDGSAHATRARWLQGLARMTKAATVEAQGPPGPHDDPRPAWGAAARGIGPEAEWSRAGLALLAGDRRRARELLGATRDWEASVLRGYVEVHELQRVVQAHKDDSEPFVLADHFDASVGHAAYEHAIAEGLPIPAVHHDFGLFKGDLGDLDGAIAQYRIALSLAPGLARAELSLGKALRQRGDLGDAVHHLRRALPHLREYPSAFGELARALLQTGDVDGARAIVDEGIACHPEDPLTYNCYGIRAEIHRRGRRPDLALRDFDAAIRLRPDRAETYASRGDLHLRRGDPRAARPDFEAAIRLGRANGQTLAGRAACRAATGDVAGALDDYAAAIRAEPRQGGYHMNRAILRQRTGDVEGALADYAAAIAASPDLGDARFNRGMFLLGLRRVPEARADFDRFVELAPEDAEGWYMRGVTRLQQSELDGAIEDLTRAVERNPRMGKAWRVRADARLMSGDAAGGIADLRTATEAGPNVAEFHAALGHLYGRSGDWRSAMTSCGFQKF